MENSAQNGTEKTEKEIKKIERHINELYERILEKRPSRFAKRDVINAFFASLMLGLMFLFKGALIQISRNLDIFHIIAIIIFTLGILTLEIYFVGYTRISLRQRKKRHFSQFWAKRIAALYLITLFVSVLIVYIYSLNTLVSDSYLLAKIVIAVSMPCAIGAAIPSLLKQY